MNANHESTSVRRPGKWSSLFVLSLISGVLFQQTATVWAQTPAAKPGPDLIVFTNGDQLTGTLESATGGSFVFKSDIVGEVTVKADNIKELRSQGKFVALKNGEKVTRTEKTPATITYQDNAVALADRTSSSAVETIPVKDLSALIDGATYTQEVTGNPGIFQDWSGGVSGGVTLVESTNTGQTFTAAVNLIRLVPSVTFLSPRTRDTIDVLETYGKLTQPVVPQTNPPSPDSVAKTNIFHADAEHDKYLTPRLYGFAGLSYDHNFSQGLDLQQIYGGGIGYTVIKTPVQEFDVKADLHYERQNFVPPTTSNDLIGSSFSELYHRTLPKKIVFTESGTYIQSWNDTSIYSAIFEAGLLIPTYKRFGFNLDLQDNYLSNPALGFKNNSFQFVTGVTYTLK